jgi:hypothetical protein
MKIQIKTIQQQQKRLGYLRRGGISAHRLRSHDQGNNGKEEEQSLHVERDKETKKKKGGCSSAAATLMEVPLELWEAVLHIAALDHFDLLSFGRTCKRFHRASWSLRRGFILSIGTFSLRSILQHLKNFDLVSEIRWLRLLEPRYAFLSCR